jgi:hypothetical protein
MVYNTVCTQGRRVTTRLVTSQMDVVDSHLSYHKPAMTSRVTRPPWTQLLLLPIPCSTHIWSQSLSLLAQYTFMLGSSKILI